MEITKDKITEIFCIIDDFCQEYDKEIARMSICESNGRKHRNRKCTMSRSEIMTILICFHFNTFRNFKHYYLFYVKAHLHDLFPKQLSYITALLNSSPESRLRWCCSSNCFALADARV